jgi:hypothetical protein
VEEYFFQAFAVIGLPETVLFCQGDQAEGKNVRKMPFLLLL